MDLEALKAGIGQDAGISGWIRVTRAEIAAFADLTRDHAPIHVDDDAARGFGLPGVIAHGFHTLSLLSQMSYRALGPFAGETHGFNSGLDRVRFVAPVPAGARLRGHFVLASVTEKAPGEVETAFDVTVEIEGHDRPALVARWLQRRYFEP